METDSNDIQNIFDEESLNAKELQGAIYDELRQIAAKKMASEQSGHTLQPTALVNEAYLRLCQSDDERMQQRPYFFAAAAEAMRRVLIDSARRKQQQKRGENPDRVDLQESQIVAPVADEKLLQVHDALDELAREDPMTADVVKMRFFVGLTHDEIAEALEINEKTVRRHWAKAKLRLFELIAEGQTSE
jgi:RNA polymerase sigma factor (TIGR02999 family)